MNHYEQGDIYSVAFDPATGHEFKGLRLAVIITSTKTTKRASVLSCLPLTSNTDNFIKGFDIKMTPSPTNNLRRESVIKGQYICTFDKTRFGKYIGKLDELNLETIKSYIKNNFDLK